MFQLSGSLSTKFEKTKASNQIKCKIRHNQPLGEECFMFNLPDVGDHKYHFVGTSAALPMPLDSRVRKHIVNLYQKGERDAVVISNLLEDYVKRELNETDRQRRRFYPDMLTVRTIMCRLKKANLDKCQINQKSIKLSVPRESEGDDPAGSGDVLFMYQNNYKKYLLSNPTLSFDKQEERHNEDGSPVEVLEISRKQYETMNLKGSRKRHLNSCKTAIRSIESAMWYLDEDKLETLTNTLEHLFLKISQKVTTE